MSPVRHRFVALPDRRGVKCEGWSVRPWRSARGGGRRAALGKAVAATENISRKDYGLDSVPATEGVPIVVSSTPGNAPVGALPGTPTGMYVTRVQRGRPAARPASNRATGTRKGEQDT